MIAPFMSLTEKLGHARQDLVSVRRKIQRKVREMEHSLKASCIKPLTHSFHKDLSPVQLQPLRAA